MDPWNPRQYELFKAERSQPGRDLIALVRPRPGQRIIDLGCGTGELTAQLQQHCPASDLLGIDSSARMLIAAQKRSGAGLRFEVGDILALPLEPKYDVIFSNAALQWLPDHPALLAFLTERLPPGGQLAVQVPAMQNHPSHRVAAEVAREPRFARQLNGFVHAVLVPTPAEYAKILFELGYVEQNVRLQIYPHVLASPEGVIDWAKGTLLTAYEQRLDAETFGDFVAEYRRRLLDCIPATSPHFYPFQRILLWGQLK